AETVVGGSELKLRLRERIVRRRGVSFDDSFELVDGAVGLKHRIELARKSQPRPHASDLLRVDPTAADTVQQLPPRRSAGRTIMNVDVLHLGDVLKKQRIRRISFVEGVEQLE